MLAEAWHAGSWDFHCLMTQCKSNVNSQFEFQVGIIELGRETEIGSLKLSENRLLGFMSFTYTLYRMGHGMYFRDSKGNFMSWQTSAI